MAVRTTLRISSSLKGSPPLRLHGVALLQRVKPRVEAVRRDKVFMGARLGDGAVFDHEDRIYAPDQPELVGDDEGGVSFCQDPPALLDGGGGLGVESGLGLVQDQNRGVPEHGPRDGDALPLSTAQTLTALGEHGVVAFWQLPDKIVSPRELCYGLDLFSTRPWPPVGDVLGDRRPEEQGVLRHEGY